MQTRAVALAKPEFDLNLSNYKLSELLTLFKLQPNFTETELKQAKRIVYQMHPDKSGLSPDFFRFFQNAHKTLEDVLSFTKSRSGISASTSASSSSTSYSSSLENLIQERRNDSNLLEGGGRIATTSNAKLFNRDFNRAFEETGSTLLNPQNGYSQWLKQGNLEEEGGADERSFQRMKEKYRSQQLAVYKEPEMFSGWSSSGTMLEELMEDNPDAASTEHNSGMFDTVQYQDLKQAHTLTVIPVTDADFESRKKYASLDELKQERSRQALNPMNEMEARNLLEERQRFDQERGMHRAFRFAQEMEKGQQRSQQFERMFQQLKN